MLVKPKDGEPKLKKVVTRIITGATARIMLTSPSGCVITHVTVDDANKAQV
jgi:hypothetical protein